MSGDEVKQGDERIKSKEGWVGGEILEMEPTYKAINACFEL